MQPPPAATTYVPALDQAAALLARAGADDGRWAHSTAVATVALRLGAALNRAGLRLDLDAVTAGGLLHDIGKGEPDHARAGAQMVDAAGYPGIAAIVASHTELDPADDSQIGEAEVVFLADKLVRRDRCVPLALRFDYASRRFADDADALAAVARRRGMALRCRDRLAIALGADPESIAVTPSGHSLEANLAAVLESLGLTRTGELACWPTHHTPATRTEELS